MKTASSLRDWNSPNGVPQSALRHLLVSPPSWELQREVGEDREAPRGDRRVAAVLVLPPLCIEAEPARGDSERP